MRIAKRLYQTNEAHVVDPHRIEAAVRVDHQSIKQLVPIVGERVEASVPLNNRYPLLTIHSKVAFLWLVILAALCFFLICIGICLFRHWFGEIQDLLVVVALSSFAVLALLSWEPVAFDVGILYLGHFYVLLHLLIENYVVFPGGQSVNDGFFS